MNLIKKYRSQAGLLQADLGEKLGLTQGAISHYELGTRIPSVAVCRQILAVLKAHGVECTLDDVFPASDEIAA